MTTLVKFKDQVKMAFQSLVKTDVKNALNYIQQNYSIQIKGKSHCLSKKYLTWEYREDGVLLFSSKPNQAISVSNKQITSLTQGLFEWMTTMGDFNIVGCHQLRSLRGAPNLVLGNFRVVNCSSIDDIKNAPMFINGDFYATELPQLYKGGIKVAIINGRICIKDNRNLSVIDELPLLATKGLFIENCPYAEISCDPSTYEDNIMRFLTPYISYKNCKTLSEQDFEWKGKEAIVADLPNQTDLNAIIEWWGALYLANKERLKSFFTNPTI